MKTSLEVAKRAGQMLLLTVFAVFVFFTVELISHLNNYILPWNKSSAVASALDYGGLPSLPGNAREIEISTTGSAFSRSFELSFVSSPKEIKNWITKSYGISESEFNTSKLEVQKFIIDISKVESNGGWVEVRWQEGIVRVYVEWS